MTRVQNQLDRVDEGIANYQRVLLPQARNLPGFEGGLLGIDRSSGAGISVTYWETEELLRAGENDAAAIRAQATQATGVTVRDIDAFELVVAERASPPQASTFARLNDIRSSLDRIDGMIQFAREQVLPALRDQPGFCAGILGVNRQSGGCSSVPSGTPPPIVMQVSCEWAACDSKPGRSQVPITFRWSCTTSWLPRSASPSRPAHVDEHLLKKSAFIHSLEWIKAFLAPRNVTASNVSLRL
jgi:hypothetical protein